jgi:hypothetical protein
MLERIRNFLTAPESKASRTARLIAFESGAARWTCANEKYEAKR